MMAWYISFVRALDPNTYRLPESQGGGPAWMTWGDENKRMLIETEGGSRMERVGEEEAGRCRFWLGLGRGVLRQR